MVTGTFAWIVWSSKDNTKMNVTIGELADVSFKTGSDINISNLFPSFNYDDGALTEFTIRKKKGLTTELNTSIYLDVTSIDEELKNANFKYVLLSSSDGKTYNEVVSDNFKDAVVGKLSIIDDNSLADNKTYYKFYIWINGNNENNETMQIKNMKASLNVDVSEPNNYATTKIKSLDDGTTGDNGSGVYKVHHDAILSLSESGTTGNQMNATDDYRYYGPDPSNYICLDKNSDGTCSDKHLYRIIGSIYEEVQSTYRLKVIKATPLTDGTNNEFNWDYNSDGSYSNIWAEVTNGNYSNSLTNGSQLMKLLNSGSWWNGNSEDLYYYYNGKVITKTVNFNDYKLSDTAKSYIMTSRYYLGGLSREDNTCSNQSYNYERALNRYNSNLLYWDGMIGLMYASDYGYAAGNDCAINIPLQSYNYESNYNNNLCYNNDWLTSSEKNNESLMMPLAYSDSDVFYISYSGYLHSYFGMFERTVRPVFYLSKDVVITGGTGTIDDPYTIGL